MVSSVAMWVKHTLAVAVLCTTWTCTAAFAEQTAESIEAFPGRIEALVSHEISNLIDGLIAEIHFKPGQKIKQGDLLYTLDATDYELAVESTRLKATEADAALQSARQDFDRMSKLKNRGLTTEVEMFKTELALSVGTAKVSKAKADVKAAEIDLSRTVIRAPIDGVISRSRVNPGAYVEQGDTPLAQIVQMDPVLLTYVVPYVERLERLGIGDLTEPQDILQTAILTVKVSENWIHPETSKPQNISARVDSGTGTMTIYAELANPTFTLRPGMRVTVVSRIEGK